MRPCRILRRENRRRFHAELREFRPSTSRAFVRLQAKSQFFACAFSFNTETDRGESLLADQFQSMPASASWMVESPPALGEDSYTVKGQQLPSTFPARVNFFPPQFRAPFIFDEWRPLTDSKLSPFITCRPLSGPGFGSRQQPHIPARLQLHDCSYRSDEASRASGIVSNAK